MVMIMPNTEEKKNKINKKSEVRDPKVLIGNFKLLQTSTWAEITYIFVLH